MLNLKKLVQAGKKHKLLKIPVLAILLAAMAVAQCAQLVCMGFSRRSVRRVAAILTAVCVITVGLPMDSLAAVTGAGENGGVIQETRIEGSTSAHKSSEETQAGEPEATASDSRKPDSSQIQGEDSCEESLDPEEDTELVDDVNVGRETDGSVLDGSISESETTGEGETSSQEVPGGYEKTDAMLAVSAMIEALPTADELDGLEVGDEGFADYMNSLKVDAAAARTAYDALSKEEQENFPSEELDKLTALEAALTAALPTVNLLTLPQMNGLTNPITIKINDGPETGGADLQAAVGATVLSSITKLEVTAGTVTQDDWNWFTGHKEDFTGLTDFETAPGVPVAALPGLPFNEPISQVFPTSIVSVSMPELTEIGQSAFAGCTALETIHFPQVTTMGIGAFAECTSLTEANFPKISPQLPKQAFYKCTALASISFPRVTKLGFETFYKCIALTNVSFPELVTIPRNPNTGNFTFKGCTALESVSMPKLGELRCTAFDDCTSLKTLKLPATPPMIDDGNPAFSNCPAPRTLILVDGSGAPLTGTALAEAQTAYDNVTDNNNIARDNLWCGWTVKDTTPGFVPKNGGLTLDAENKKIYANGNAITAIEGMNSERTKLYYTDDPARASINLDEMG